MRAMLHIDPSKRLTAAQILQHPWITNRASLPDNKLAIKNAGLKGAVEATFTALAKPVAPTLESVNNSDLAQRRKKRKSSIS